MVSSTLYQSYNGFNDTPVVYEMETLTGGKMKSPGPMVIGPDNWLIA